MSDRHGDELLAVIDEIYDAWRGGDTERVLAQLAEDVEFVFAVGQRPLQGKARVKRLLDFLAGNQREVRWRPVHRARSGNVVFVEGIDDYVNGEGHRVRNPYVTVYEFEGDKIRRWRDYYDQATLQAIEGGEPLSEWILPLVSDERGQGERS